MNHPNRSNKRYAVLIDDQLLFNFREGEFDPSSKWIEQTERGTVDRWENKYNQKLDWMEKEHPEKNDVMIAGYFLTK